MANERQVITGEHGGVSYEIAWGVEKNTKGFNRNASVRLFFPGTGELEADEAKLAMAAKVGNRIAFYSLNEMEDNEIDHLNQKG